ncbi:CHASE3 domain-containing protein [Variovorax sp. J22G21]|uniref:CHASE3 domain-containing protein n=1 Tax=Variovorax fucosicus TaxID=3053517 RepID=UPI002575F707|nr:MULTISPECIES: CHASE3 domain-containing protein [unclassified Variovorax]MDM0038096.1 CHASE3 domain-containing protein [Variovorax sp. J22R193]MDM0056230.1 CHASE3 domain-containing protein [Variovorax sp. J22G47]MDM0062872.1 CHASE3 domain-containing protein [Variovorax sp. J22G21]
MRWLVVPKMALSLVLAALAALVLIGINEAGYRESRRALNEISEAQLARAALNGLLQNILDAETGQRGYLLTGEASYREPYDGAVKKVDGNLASLRALYAERPDEQARLNRLSGHVARKLAEMDMSLRLRQSGSDDAWKFVLTTDVGREEMNAIRVQASELIAVSNHALAVGQQQISRALTLGRLGIGLVALFALLAFWLYLRQTHALRSAGERQQEALQRERNALETEVSERTATLTELATHLQDVRETERGYLARELHDELGSLLTAAKLDVARLKSRLADSPDATQRLQHLTELLNSGIALKRRIIEDLRPSSLANLGLVASLEILGREFGDRSGVQIDLALEPVLLDEARQLTVYRMVQESLTNIGKYAQATEATIVLKNYGNHVIVEVTDNGKGFEPDAARPSTHGLAGMRHRVQAASGKLTVTSAPGQGTRLMAMIPVQRN